MTSITAPQPLSSEGLLRYRVVSEVKVEQLRDSSKASAVEPNG
jgi:hypothetical protein